MTTINMSEYQERHTVSQLKGAPPGYVGYGEGGILTEAVRRRPYSVVLLDEVEKADREVMNLFYQVFDRGFMRDGEGREIDFKNTVIVMTSNLGADEMLDAVSHDTVPDPEEMNELIRPILIRHFQSALLARLRIVPFYPLSPEAIEKIVSLKMNALTKRLVNTHGIAVDVAADVITNIAERCEHSDIGARNIDLVIERFLLPGISKTMVERLADGNIPKRLQLMVQDGEIRYEFS
jgi:type VI secretion system protein VasG